MPFHFLCFVLVCAVNGGQAWAQPLTAKPVPGTDSTQKSVHVSASTEQTEAMKLCFGCGGSGKRDCVAPGCKDGQVECSGPCLRLTKGKWVHMEVVGHRPDKLWQKFRSGDGTYECWATSHVGEVIEMQNGKPVNVGPCLVCLGTTRVKCPACRGTSLAACHLCAGKQVVPISWTEFNNPKQKVRPTLIQLKDGRTVFGKIQMRLGSKVYAKTEDGKQVELNAGEILSEKTAP